MLASDADSGQNGQVRFTKLSGDPVVERSLVLDSSTGEVSVSEGAIFDRESSDSKSTPPISGSYLGSLLII